MNTTEIENWFMVRAREFTLNPQGMNNSFVELVQEYNQKYVDNNLLSKRKFNPIIFANLFTKIRTISFSTKTIKNKDFILYRKLLITEINYYSKDIAMDFVKVLSDYNIKLYTKEIYNSIYIMFSHFVEIYINLHQYKEVTINTNIKIAKTYLEEVINILTDKELKLALEHIYDFLKFIYDEYKYQLKFAST